MCSFKILYKSLFAIFIVLEKVLFEQFNLLCMTSVTETSKFLIILRGAYSFFFNKVPIKVKVGISINVLRQKSVFDFVRYIVFYLIIFLNLFFFILACYTSKIVDIKDLLPQTCKG